MKQMRKVYEDKNSGKKSYTDLKLLYEKIDEYGGEINRVARMACIDKTVLHRKMRGEVEFNMRDISKLSYTLNLNWMEVYRIFLKGYMPPMLCAAG